MDGIYLKVRILGYFRQTLLPILHETVYRYLFETVITVDPLPPHDITSESHSVLNYLSILQQFMVYRTTPFGECFPQDRAFVFLDDHS